MTLAYVGLGANLGGPRRQLEQALAELAGLPETRLLRRSSFYRTRPIGYAEQADFVNAVAQLETALAAEPLLAELHAIEVRHGRERSFANAPRTLDLDLLLHGNAVICTENLKLPHPRMHERAFVLAPLVEIAPDVAVPGRGLARDLLAACTAQRVERTG